MFSGASGVRRSPSPGRPSSGAGSRGSATRVSRVRSVRAWGPSTGPTACALAGRRCSLWGWRKGVPGEGAFHHCEGRRRSGAPPPPTARPLGRLLRSAIHVLWARVDGRGDPSPTPQRALLRAGFARCGGGTRVPGGGTSCLGVGRPGSGALPPPTSRPFGRAAGAHYPLAVGAGGAGVGTRHQPHSARSCALWGRHEGARGGAFCLGVGRPGSGALPPPTIRPFGRAAWAHYPLASGAGGVGVRTRHQPQSVRSCQLTLRAVGAARGLPGGGAPLAWV